MAFRLLNRVRHPKGVPSRNPSGGSGTIRDSEEDREMTPTVYPEQVLGYVVLASVAALATYYWLLLPAIRHGARQERKAARSPGDHRAAEARRPAAARSRRQIAEHHHRQQRRMVASVVSDQGDPSATAPPTRRRHRRSAA